MGQQISCCIPLMHGHAIIIACKDTSCCLYDGMGTYGPLQQVCAVVCITFSTQ